MNSLLWELFLLFCTSRPPRNPESDDYYGGGDGGDHDDGPGDDGHNGDNDKQNSEFNYR